MAIVKSINVSISAVTQGFESGLSRARKSLNNFVSGTLGTIGQLAGVSVSIYGVATAMKSMIGTSEEFAKSMAVSTAIMGNVTDDLRARMEMTAKQVAMNTMFSAAEAAKGYFYLASAGFDAENAVAAMPVVAKFAQAGMFDLAKATQLAATAQIALGLNSADPVKNIEQLTRVTDVLSKGNILATTEIEQLAVALTNDAAGAMKMVGMQLEEGVAILAAYAATNMTAEEAGTNLAIMLRDLQRAAIENEEAFRLARVSVFDSNEEFRKVADILSELESKMLGLSDMARKELMINLGFNEKSAKSLQTLIGMSGTIRDFESQLMGAGGTTSDIASKNIPEYTKNVNQLKATWEAFSIQIGTQMTEALNQSTDGVNVFGQALATVADVTWTIYLAWLAIKPAIVILQSPVMAIKRSIAEIGIGIANVIGSMAAVDKMLPGIGLGADAAESIKAEAQAYKAYFESIRPETEPVIDEMRQVIDDLSTAFLDDTPGQKFLRTLEQMRKPLQDITYETNEGAAAAIAQKAAFESVAGVLFKQQQTSEAVLAETQQRVADRFEAFAERLAADVKQREAMESKAAQLKEQFQSPIETFATKVAELQSLQREKLIDESTFAQAFAEARTQFTEGLATEFAPLIEAVKGPAAIQGGRYSNESFSAFQEAKRNQDFVAKQTDYQKRMEAHLAEMVRRGVVLAEAKLAGAE